MSLEKSNQLGIVRINDYIFAKIILAAVAHTEGKAFCASEKGKILGGINQKVSVSELASNIKCFEEDGRYILEFSIIVLFGTSIKKVSDIIFEYIEKETAILLSDKPRRIVLKIVGVKSKQIAERNLEIVKDYES